MRCQPRSLSTFRIQFSISFTLFHPMIQPGVKALIYVYSDVFGKHFLDVSTIVWIEAANNYSVIHTSNKKQITLSKTLSIVEQEVRKFNTFFRIHYSHIINYNHISSILRKDGGSILLSDGTLLQLARRRKVEFFEFIERLNKPNTIKNQPDAK